LSAIIILLFCCFCTINSIVTPCTNCSSCANHAACTPAVCPSCPSLSQSLTQQNILLIQVNWTLVDPLYAFFGRVICTYTGSNTETIVGTLNQNTSDPCFTQWYKDEPYIVATVYDGTNRRPNTVHEKGLCNMASSKMGFTDPGCFFIQLNQCDYFKLVTDLTQQERNILNTFTCS